MNYLQKAQAGEGYMPARRAWERYGVTSMTLSRWIADPRVAFPKPFYFGRNRYFKFSELEAWERDRTGKVATEKAA